MGQLLFCGEHFAAILADEVKKYSEQHNAPIIKAFKDVVAGWYYYSDNQLELRGYTDRMSKSDYYNAFCKFVLSDERNKAFLPNEYRQMLRQYYYYTREYPILDKEYFAFIKAAVKEEQKERQELEERTRDILKVLGHQPVPLLQVDMLYDIVESLRLKEYSSLATLVYIFNYGYIQGKRAERAKKGA